MKELEKRGFQFIKNYSYPYEFKYKVYYKGLFIGKSRNENGCIKVCKDFKEKLKDIF